jgi:hypothetical protein
MCNLPPLLNDLWELEAVGLPNLPSVIHDAEIAELRVEELLVCWNELIVHIEFQLAFIS